MKYLIDNEIKDREKFSKSVKKIYTSNFISIEWHIVRNIVTNDLKKKRINEM